jgi:16S rRNA processing protein RimM
LPPDAKGAPREAKIERHWLHKGRVVLKFVGVDSISDASPFARWRVAIPREERAPLADDAVYVADLIGCHLIDEAGGAVDLGPVLDVERGAGDALDILVLNSGEDELLIPFAKAYLVSLDLDARVVRMRLPAGLTTINAPMTEEERAAQRQASQKDEADDAL